MIRVRNLEKTFAGAKGEVRALCGVSFEVRKGELFTLLGPSGCGKTTTLRCIAGLEQPVQGEISIDDRIMYSAGSGIFIAPEKRRIGMVTLPLASSAQSVASRPSALGPPAMVKLPMS